MYQVIRDNDSARYYKGNGDWAMDRQDALVFGDLTELMAECAKRGMRKCRVVEIFPRTGEFEFNFTPVAAA